MKRSTQKTAKIYKFPDRPRAKALANPIALLEAEAAAVGSVEFGSGWYHDEAIAKANGFNKRQ